jgi:hypothetical protein
MAHFELNFRMYYYMEFPKRKQTPYRSKKICAPFKHLFPVVPSMNHYSTSSSFSPSVSFSVCLSCSELEAVCFLPSTFLLLPLLPFWSRVNVCDDLQLDYHQMKQTQISTSQDPLHIRPLPWVDREHPRSSGYTLLHIVSPSSAAEFAL